jgi:hypothetical protein
MELKRNTTPVKMRNYGRIVQDMISYATSLEPGLERDSLEVYIAHCMRQRNMVWNRDQEAGVNRVKEDIIRMSNGKLRCESSAFERFMANPNASPMAKRKVKSER